MPTISHSSCHHRTLQEQVLVVIRFHSCNNWCSFCSRTKDWPPCSIKEVVQVEDHQVHLEQLAALTTTCLVLAWCKLLRSWHSLSNKRADLNSQELEEQTKKVIKIYMTQINTAICSHLSLDLTILETTVVPILTAIHQLTFINQQVMLTTKAWTQVTSRRTSTPWATLVVAVWTSLEATTCTATFHPKTSLLTSTTITCSRTSRTTTCNRLSHHRTQAHQLPSGATTKHKEPDNPLPSQLLSLPPQPMTFWTCPSIPTMRPLKTRAIQWANNRIEEDSILIAVSHHFNLSNQCITCTHKTETCLTLDNNRIRSTIVMKTSIQASKTTSTPERVATWILIKRTNSHHTSKIPSSLMTTMMGQPIHLQALVLLGLVRRLQSLKRTQMRREAAK
mgnify:CR=1 FL=1